MCGIGDVPSSPPSRPRDVGTAERGEAEDRRRGLGGGADSGRDDTFPLPLVDETNLTNVAEENGDERFSIFRADEGTLVEVVWVHHFMLDNLSEDDIPPSHDLLEVGQSQAQRINPRLDLESSTNVPTISFYSRGRRQPEQWTMRI